MKFKHLELAEPGALGHLERSHMLRLDNYHDRGQSPVANACFNTPLAASDASP